MTKVKKTTKKSQKESVVEPAATHQKTAKVLVQQSTTVLSKPSKRFMPHNMLAEIDELTKRVAELEKKLAEISLKLSDS